MMQTNEIILRAGNLFAFIRVFPLILLSVFLLLLAWCLSSFFMVFSIAVLVIVWYRFLLIRSCRYFIEQEFIRVRSGVFFKRMHQVQLYQVKDYIITQPFLHQLFKIMDLVLKTTDPGTPVIILRGIPESDIIDIIRERVQQARKRGQNL